MRADVAPLVVAPRETGAVTGHLLDNRVALTERVGPGVTGLGFAAADVSALGARTQVEAAAAFLAPFGARLREHVGRVRAESRLLGRTGEYGIDHLHRGRIISPRDLPSGLAQETIAWPQKTVARLLEA